MIPAAQFLFWIFLHLPLKFFLRAQVIGLEKIPSPPFILAANHTAWFDPFLLLVLPFSTTHLIPIHFLTASFYHNRWYLRPLLNLLGSYPTTPKAWTWDQLLANSLDKLRAGNVVLIFPEGQRKLSDRPLTAKPGIIHLALEGQVSILPLHVAGHEKMSLGEFLLRKRQLVLKFGDRIILNSHVDPQNYQPEAQKVVNLIYQLQ